MDLVQFEDRKRDHLRHALDSAHQAVGLSGLEQVRLIHEALPELNFDEVSLETDCLGARLATPFFVAGMTAGHADAARINRTLATVCEARGWAMGVGSQRRQLEALDSSGLDQWEELRREAPRLVLFANLGIAQAIQVPLDRIRRLVGSIQAQALVIHANALQECMQPEGTPQFRGAAAALEKICRELELPVVLKETGCGFSPATLKRLAGIGLSAIDISGLGGTHWGRIEGARAETLADSGVRATASKTFADWGVPTVDSVRAAATVLPASVKIWATGGVRSGLDAAKLIALGAQRVGYAKPALVAALDGPDALARWMDLQEFELKTALFCTGCANSDQLRQKEGVWKNGN